MKNLPKIFIIILVLSAIGIAIYLIIGNFEFFTSKLKLKKNTQSTGQVIALVGKEKIFSEDIVAIQTAQYNRSKQEVVDQVVKESKILQNAVKMGLVKVPENYFSDDVPINNVERQKYIEQAEKKYEENSMQVEGVLLTVFFYNQQVPKGMTFEEADKKAFVLITAIRDRIVTGDLQPASAITILADSPEVAQLDWNAKFNTGTIFNKEAVWRLTSDQLYRETIQKMPLGEGRQVSEVVRYPGPKDKYPERYFDSDLKNGYYFIFVLNNKTDGYIQSFREYNE